MKQGEEIKSVDKVNIAANPSLLASAELMDLRREIIKSLSKVNKMLKIESCDQCGQKKGGRACNS